MKKALVVGGSNGIGLAIVNNFIELGYEEITIMDKREPALTLDGKINYIPMDLTLDDFDIFDEYVFKIDTLMITAGYGRVAPFATFEDREIYNNLNVNGVAPIRILNKFYPQLEGENDFYCGVMGSIAGFISSPMFSVYGAGKAAIDKLIESVNIELEKSGTKNRILNVSPGSIRGTSFSGGQTDTKVIDTLSKNIIKEMQKKNTLYIPDLEIYGNVLARYHRNPYKFGLESYDYKLSGGRINTRPQLKIGYLSGTFDLFHIGHLNLLRRAKQYCDYLIVGVHQDASHKGKETFISFEERMEILKSNRYVDKVVPSQPEDITIWNEIYYDYLFVGSDYKGTERFKYYEDFFKDKDTEIIYFDYTQGTSSSKLRMLIDKSIEGKEK
ncbi:Glycerol-3-phosphate cytidylyltransferase [Enterococcus faecalis FL2]|uniref:SDR family NAD(P)-dependent oxidoreductase n=1 Tax=Enterococcus TaxID=1350 RepID=UPI00045BA985|nr:SDR family NAD(P)-dependent oxidoreductase [Enterococcus faecalis]EHS2295512.1 SDR family NAD(P)-dependent oxidoreductase [Enterococcus faecalis]KAJ60709.1 Glycerol-3-phosphate cytidylyltransferase [Enterococcus faecalis FL2]